MLTESQCLLLSGSGEPSKRQIQGKQKDKVAQNKAINGNEVVTRICKASRGLRSHSKSHEFESCT
jgi:hypothetical protein